MEREPAVGDLLGAYRLEKVAGEGAMGRVFRARHEKLGRTVALKVLRRKYGARPEVVQRFFQEARAVNVIRHPNIVEITDFVEGERGAASYYIMEWLSGDTLARRLSEGPLPASEAVEVARQVAAALGAAHRAGFVHRDLAPTNVVLGERAGELQVKVLDFGLAQLDGESDGAVAGTPAYLSPEVCAGRGATPRSDIYALGCVLYEMLSGAPPFEAEGLSEYVMKHMTQPPRPLARSARVSPELAELVERCLRKAPDERFASMEELGEALAQVAGAPPRRWWRLVIPAAAVAAAVGIGMAIAHRSSVARDPVAPVVEAPKVAAPPPAPPAPTRGEVAVASTPDGAEVYSPVGVLLGTTPCTLRLPPGPQIVELRRDGYRTLSRTVDAAAGARVEVALEPVRKKRVEHAAAHTTANGTIDPFGGN